MAQSKLAVALVCKWGDGIMITYSDGNVAYLTVEETCPLSFPPAQLPPFSSQPEIIN